MKSISNLSLLLMIILFVTLTAAKPTTSPVNLITIACVNSTNPPLCLSVLRADDPTAKTANLKGLAFISLKAAANAAVNTSAQIKASVDQGSVKEPELEDGLRNCAESYLNVVDQIDDSVDALATEKFENVDMWIKAAAADIVTCDGNLKGQTVPLAKEILEKNQNVTDLCTNALEVVHNLAKSN